MISSLDVSSALSSHLVCTRLLVALPLRLVNCTGVGTFVARAHFGSIEPLVGL